MACTKTVTVTVVRCTVPVLYGLGTEEQDSLVDIVATNGEVYTMHPSNRQYEPGEKVEVESNDHETQ